MCVWYSLRPLKRFSLDELKSILLELARFHYDVLGYKRKNVSYYETLALEFLSEQFRIYVNSPESMNFGHIFHVSSCDPEIESTYRYVDDPKGTKEQTAKKNLRKLQQFNPIFNQFEIEYNYEY